MRLDLGAGQRCKEGFVGVDIVPRDGSILCNLFREEWIFGSVVAADNSVDEIWCSHFVEHVPDLITFMNEMHRVMKPGATATIIAPYYANMRAFQDPTHVRFITDATFWYFDAQWRKREHLDHYPIRADFEIVTVVHHINQKFSHLNTPEREHELREAMAHQWNVVDDIHVVLRKR